MCTVHGARQLLIRSGYYFITCASAMASPWPKGETSVPSLATTALSLQRLHADTESAKGPRGAEPQCSGGGLED